MTTPGPVATDGHFLDNATLGTQYGEMAANDRVVEILEKVLVAPGKR